MRLLAMAVGALLSCLVFYRNHKSRTYETGIKGVLQAFDLASSRTNWQLCQIICVPMVLFLAELCKMPRAMWAGIAAMSAIVPLMADMQARVKNRIIGNVAGVLCFLVLYTLLPTSIYAYIGILGGIGVGFSAKYGWQCLIPLVRLPLQRSFTVSRVQWGFVWRKMYLGLCLPCCSALRFIG